MSLKLFDRSVISTVRQLRDSMVETYPRPTRPNDILEKFWSLDAGMAWGQLSSKLRADKELWVALQLPSTTFRLRLQFGLIGPPTPTSSPTGEPRGE